MRAFTSLLLAATAIAASACSSLQLGSGNKVPFRSLYVPPVENRSYAPQVTALLSTNISEAFIRDGGVRIVDKADADATLRVRIVDYVTDVAAHSSNDTGRVSAQGMTLIVEATLVSRDGAVLMDRRRFSDKEVAFAPNMGELREARAQDMPMVTREIARRIKDATVNVW